MEVRKWPKRIVVDANFLVALLDPKVDPETRLRIDSFISQIEQQKCAIVIPMPVMAEYLVGADIAGTQSMNVLEKKKFVILANFDRAAAFECALLDRGALGSGDKRDGAESSWQKVKVDRQVLAIGKVNGAALVISRDTGLRNTAIRAGIDCLRIEELPLSPDAMQHKLDLDGKK